MTATVTEAIAGYKVAFVPEKEQLSTLHLTKYEGSSPYYDKHDDGPGKLPKFNGGLKSSGKLDAKYNFKDLTPAIGREYPNARLADILKDEELLRDLAITISRRGVVFFRDQEDLDQESQKKLGNLLGKLTGKPESSGLHTHPSTNAGGVLDKNGKVDPEISLIATRGYAARKRPNFGANRVPDSSYGWHSDISFEPVPSDYAILKIVETPETGGDTLWTSGYSVYDHLSDTFKEHLSKLSARYAHEGFTKIAELNNYELHTGPRGNPENIGNNLEAIHPVIRTNPVSGWNSVFAVGEHVTNIEGVTHEESEAIKTLLRGIVLNHHEYRVRFSWNKNDVAIWDNRSVFHNATRDIKFFNDENLVRTGVRVVGIGERPFFDKKGKSRSEDLKSQGLSLY